MLIIMVGINKMFIRIANTEYPDLFASSALYDGPAHEILEHYLMCAKAFFEARGLNFGLSLHLHPYKFV